MRRIVVSRPLLLTLVMVSVMTVWRFVPATAQDRAATPMTAAGAPVAFVWQAEVTGGANPLQAAQDVTIDPEGNLWVLDIGNHQFQIFSPDGTLLETWGRFGEGEGEFNFFAGPIAIETDFGGDLAFDSAGNFYVADMANQRIQKFAPDRTFLLAWGSEGDGDGQFNRPWNLAIDDQDNIYVADFGRNTVQQFTSDGTFLRTVVESGGGEDELTGAGGIAIDAEGNLWVADWTSNRLLQFGLDGEHRGTYGGTGSAAGQLNVPTGITVSTEGLVYVADMFNHRVQVFDASGQTLTSWGANGADPGQFSYPAGVALDGAGHVYVAELGNHRLQKFRLLPPLVASDAS